MSSEHFYSHGKLLLTGEYLVLEGAKALAIPCKFGQHLEISQADRNISTWVSYDHDNQIWLDIEFDLSAVIDLKIKAQNEYERRLFQILKETYRLNSKVFTQNYNFKTRLEFPQNWGLGTSSTLISNIAKWAGVDPYQLLSKTFGGSGYDIACADAESPLVYSIKAKKPIIENTTIPEVIKPYLFFVHLGEKQNSREAISSYKAMKPGNLKEFISEINYITEEFQKVETLTEAQELVFTHEKYLSEILKIESIQSRLFPGFEGAIKSLGAWGGDFILVISEKNPTAFFKNKGYPTILTYAEMSL